MPMATAYVCREQATGKWGFADKLLEKRVAPQNRMSCRGL